MANKQGGMPGTAGAEVKRRNDGLDLSAFTYRGRFVDEDFKKYTEMVEGVFKRTARQRQPQLVAAGLPQTVTYDFVGYKVKPVRDFINPEDQNDTRTKLIGFEIVQEQPVRETATTLKNILQLNSQIHGAAMSQTMIYYLLKKY